MKSMTVQQLRESDTVALIDVREADEYAAGHVPGAVSVPMSTIIDHLGELPGGPLYLICQSGARSARVAQALEKRGYDATNVEGGTSEWIALGYAVEN